MQPDSIIPSPVNPQSWNRFAYVLNNPIRYNDPTGHVCSDPEDPTPSCESKKGTLSKDYASRWLRSYLNDRYDWNVASDFTEEELIVIRNTAYDIEAYVNDLTDGMGLEWMQAALGNTTIVHAENFGEHSETWPTLHGPKIWLGKGWLNDGGWDSKQLLAHELGHVWDIRSGLSNSGRLHANLGGLSALCFFCKPDRNVPRWSPLLNNGYGNSGINDYFAEAFSWTIYGGTPPPGVSPLINGYITEEVFYLPDW